MDTVSLAHAQQNLGELLDRVEAGEEITILRDGKVVAELRRATSEKQPIDWAALKALRERLPYQHESSAETIRKMRDEGF